MFKICKYCDNVFELEDRRGTKRNHCYDPDCVEAFYQEQLEKMRARKIAWYEKQKGKKITDLCTKCKKRPIKEGNRFLCEECMQDANGMLDMGTGEGIDRTTRRKIY